MNGREELIMRCAHRRNAKLGGLSEKGFAELVEAVRANVADFIDTPEDAAFAEVVAAKEVFERAMLESEALDDEAYGMARAKALDTLRKSCRHAMNTDPACVDARHMFIAAAPPGIGSPDHAYAELLVAYRDSQAELDAISEWPGGLSWENVFLRPHARLLAALARHCVFCTRYRLAISWGEELIGLCPDDEPGIRHSMDIAYARLEDEDGLNRLDSHFGNESTPWSLLSRAILLYRLERYSAARRALKGYVNLVKGGAYALLRPILLLPYLPDRPDCEPRSFEAAMQAIYEMETVIADTPGFVWWAQNQPETVASAKQFADANGYDWDN